MRPRASLVAAVLVASFGSARAQEQVKSDAERLADLEKKLAEQQKQLDDLKAHEKPKAIDEKGAVQQAQNQSFDWGYNDGFYVKGDINGAGYMIRPHARLQLDYRAFPYSSKNLAYNNAVPEDQFLVRRARVGFLGNFGPFEFMFDADPIRSPLPIADFWFQWHQIDEFQIRFGSFKAPFDFDDSQTSDLYLDMVERPIPTGSGNQITPDYRIGAEVFGRVADGLFSYFFSVVNQPDSNTVQDGDPLYTARVQTEIKGFEAGIGALAARLGTGGPKGFANSFTGATPAQYVFFAPVSVRGWEQAILGDAAFYYGPGFISGGYAYAQQARERVAADGTSGTPLVTQGGWVTVGWMLMGPITPGPHPIPFKDWEFFSMELQKKRNARNCGLELVFRMETMDIRDARGGRRFTSAAETTVATPSTSATALKVKGNQCQAGTIGLNFYPNENVKFMFDYVHLHLGDRLRAERAHSNEADEILLRAQLEF
ncbi:MAG TPA: porin [Planctomycetota bacterium]|nr:porin [Planctomycetota bacterium]